MPSKLINSLSFTLIWMGYEEEEEMPVSALTVLR